MKNSLEIIFAFYICVFSYMPTVCQSMMYQTSLSHSLLDTRHLFWKFNQTTIWIASSLVFNIFSLRWYIVTINLIHPKMMYQIPHDSIECGKLHNHACLPVQSAHEWFYVWMRADNMTACSNCVSTFFQMIFIAFQKFFSSFIMKR